MNSYISVNLNLNILFDCHLTKKFFLGGINEEVRHYSGF